MKIFAYLKSTTRLATAIFLSVCALAIVTGVLIGIYNYWDHSRAKEYESIKSWSADLKNNLQFSLVANTKLVEKKFFIKVSTDSYPSYMDDPYLRRKNAERLIVLNFADKDGFKVFSKSIPLNTLSTNLDSSGKPASLSFEDDQYMDLQTYASMAKLDVQWTIDTAIPPSSTNAQSQSENKLDHCAPNLSKAERLRRLAQYGAVRQTGDGSYAVGYRSLTFFTIDNSLLNCT